MVPGSGICGYVFWNQSTDALPRTLPVTKMSFVIRMREIEDEPNTELIRIPNAGHIPMENDHRAVGDALGRFFSSRSPS